MFDIEFFRRHFEKWLSAITDPKQFLAPNFQPSDQQYFDAVEFYVAMLTIGFVLNSPLILTRKGGLDAKGRAMANTLLGLIFSAVVASSWFLAFSWLGGGASFTGTYLAFVYSAAPYTPAMALASILMFAGVPDELKEESLNPATAKAAFKRAKDHPETNAAAMGLGSLLMLGLMIWTSYLQFSCFSFVHQLFNWELVWAILLSLLIAAPVTKVWQWISQPFLGGKAAADDKEKVGFRLPALLVAVGVFLTVAGACTILFAHARQESIAVENLGRVDGVYPPQQLFLAGAVLASFGSGLVAYVIATRLLPPPPIRAVK